MKIKNVYYEKRYNVFFVKRCHHFPYSKSRPYYLKFWTMRNRATTSNIMCSRYKFLFAAKIFAFLVIWIFLSGEYNLTGGGTISRATSSCIMRYWYKSWFFREIISRFLQFLIFEQENVTYNFAWHLFANHMILKCPPHIIWNI